jgi:hypothetical protein
LSLALREEHTLTPKKETPGRIFGHMEEEVMNDRENYIMRSVFSSSGKGVLNKSELHNSKCVDEIILKWMLKNQCVSMWTGSKWLRVIMSDDCYEQSDEA